MYKNLTYNILFYSWNRFFISIIGNRVKFFIKVSVYIQGSSSIMLTQFFDDKYIQILLLKIVRYYIRYKCILYIIFSNICNCSNTIYNECPAVTILISSFFKFSIRYSNHFNCTFLSWICYFQKCWWIKINSCLTNHSVYLIYI